MLQFGLEFDNQGLTNIDRETANRFWSTMYGGSLSRLSAKRLQPIGLKSTPFIRIRLLMPLRAPALIHVRCSFLRPWSHISVSHGIGDIWCLTSAGAPRRFMGCSRSLSLSLLSIQLSKSLPAVWKGLSLLLLQWTFSISRRIPRGLSLTSSLASKPLRTITGRTNRRMISPFR